MTNESKKLLIASINERPRHADSYFVYGCMDCGKGFDILCDEALRGKKPVPFAIQCPFCHGHSCYDVSGNISMPRRQIKADEPAFVDDGEDCGTPIHTEYAKAKYRHEKSTEATA